MVPATSSRFPRSRGLVLACALGAVACRRNDGIIDDPSCSDDLTILAAGDGGGAAAAPVATVSPGTPCAGEAGVATGSTDNGGNGFGDDAGSEAPGPPVVCGTYFCICDDTTTQSGSSADPVTGACDEEGQTCETLCSGHGGWM